MTIPDCGNAGCTTCKTVWQDGKRFVECEHGLVSVESFLVNAVTALLKDVAEIKGCVQPKTTLPKADHTGLVP